MPRLNPITAEHEDPRAAPLLDAVKAALGGTPNLFRTLAHSPAALEGYLNLSGALRGGAVSEGLGERIALATAEENGCDYCAAAHTALGSGAGLSDAEIDAARQGRATDPKSAAAVRLAKRILETRGDVSDEEVRSARAAGLSDGEITEVVAHVALNVFANYFNRVAQTEVDFPRVRPTTSFASAQD